MPSCKRTPATKRIKRSFRVPASKVTGSIIPGSKRPKVTAAKEDLASILAAFKLRDGLKCGRYLSHRVLFDLAKWKTRDAPNKLPIRAVRINAAPTRMLP